MRKIQPFTKALVGSMLLGIAAGWCCNTWLGPEQSAAVAEDLSVITNAFLRLIKMIIAPLVFSTLTASIARMNGAAEIGRVGLKAVAWFFAASVVSLSLGLIMAAALHPGTGLALPLPDGSGAAINVAKFGGEEFINHLIPRSIFEAMANNEILSIVVFSAFFGAAMAALKERAQHVAVLCDELATIMLKVTGYVMKAAPLAIFAALAATIAAQGIGIIAVYAKFVGGYYLSLLILWMLLGAALAALVGRRAIALLVAIREPTLLAFATASSEAAYPRTLEALVEFGIPRRLASFVLPLAYSFNLDGSMMYCTFAVMFVAQAYGIEVPLGQQISVFALLMLMTKGMAGVPRVSVVIVAAALPYLSLPQAGMLLVLAVDQILDMGRSATNVVGNAVAAVVVSRWERQNDVTDSN
jgi:Na+/H+-dicarboxylate symporter